MSEDQIRAKVKAAVANVCGVSVNDIADDAHFVNDLGLDSLSVIEAAVELDREFRISGLSPDAQRMFESVGDAVSFIQERIQLQSA